jgi:hypothetical protein
MGEIEPPVAGISFVAPGLAPEREAELLARLA